MFYLGRRLKEKANLIGCRVYSKVFGLSRNIVIVLEGAIE